MSLDGLFLLPLWRIMLEDGSKSVFRNVFLNEKTRPSHNGNYGEQESTPMTVTLLQVIPLPLLPCFLVLVELIISIVSYVNTTSSSFASPN